MGRRNRFLDRFKLRPMFSPSPIPVHRSRHVLPSLNNKSDSTVGTSVSSSAPLTSVDAPTVQLMSPDHVRVSHAQSATSAGENLATCAPNIPTSTDQLQVLNQTNVQAVGPSQTESTPGPEVIEFSALWTKALEIADKKLHDNNLPLLNLKHFTSQSASENIEAVVKALNTLKEDHRKKRWSYTWCGKEVIVVERLGKILKWVDNYSKVVDCAIQANPQMTALFWAGVLGIMRVSI